jgi:hypothetical protein
MHTCPLPISPTFTTNVSPSHRFHCNHHLFMSQTSTIAAASPSFQVIFDAALKSYQKQTKKDLLAHPLASQLQSCNSTTAILALLQDQVREFDKSHSGDERLTKWLGPTVNVLFAFSAAVSGGVSLASVYTQANINLKLSSDIFFSGVFARQCDLCRHRRLRFSKYPVHFIARIVLTFEIL